jgi:hypothetical protein
MAALLVATPLAVHAQAPAVRVAGLESASERDAGRTLAAAEPAPSKARLEDAAPRGKSRQVFKCWQYGKLIYEGPGGPVALDRSQAALRIGVGTTVQLYDLKSATCILEQSGG